MAEIEENKSNESDQKDNVVSFSSSKQKNESFSFEDIVAANLLKKQKLEEERKKHNGGVKRSYKLMPKGKK